MDIKMWGVLIQVWYLGEPSAWSDTISCTLARVACFSSSSGISAASILSLVCGLLINAVAVEVSVVYWGPDGPVVSPGEEHSPRPSSLLAGNFVLTCYSWFWWPPATAQLQQLNRTKTLDHYCPVYEETARHTPRYLLSSDVQTVIKIDLTNNATPASNN